jgi:hypothetical protein
MFELFDTRPDIQVQESEYQRLLGYPSPRVLEGRPRELADATRQWYAENGRPWIYARPAETLDLSGGQIKINGTAFVSPPLHEQFTTAQVHDALLVAVSAGPECEERARVLWQEGKPDEYFFLEMFGSAVVEHLVTLANGRICGWADHNQMVALPHYSPGYSGWDIAEQTKLWDLIRPTSGRDFPGQLDVMDSGMLRPKKSLLAVIGLTRHLDQARAYAKLIPCENCALPGCQYRRAPFLRFPPQIEEVGRLQPDHRDDSLDNSVSASGLDHQARYTTNLKALRIWSQERLRLKNLPDGSIAARFRYEGTTCSNLGRPLEFDYHVLLAPGHDRHRILEAACAPAPGDTGHAQQCDYLRDAAAFLAAIASEKPLLGQPLNDVLTWERAYSPSGCYCDADRRAHKWGLVFEVLHFTLVQREKDAARIGQTSAPLA